LLWEKYSTQFISIYLSFIVNQAILINVNHVEICSWNQPVLGNEGRVFCSGKQWEPINGVQTHN